MKTMEIRFTVSENIFQTLNRTQEMFVQQMRLLFAIHLFKRQELTFGQAMELAGVSRDSFLIELDKQEIPIINYEPTELEMELALFSA
jgi:predicted HTH domain antitoxin